MQKTNAFVKSSERGCEISLTYSYEPKMTMGIPRGCKEVIELAFPVAKLFSAAGCTVKQC